jgi:hypothetical protein
MEMEHQPVERQVARQSALIYLPISLGVALLFLLAASLGDYPTVARFGGAVWVGLLSLIVSMPLATAWTKRRVSGRG